MTVEATTPPEGLLPVLHELLVALLGHTGEVFVEDVISRPRKEAIPSPTSCCFRLSEDLTWICGPDRTMLNQVVRLGYHVHALERFLEHVEHQKLPGSSSPYWHAMASGITEVLDMYRAAILRVQQQLLADSRPVLSAIPHFLSSFQVLLPALHELVAQVVEQPLRGSALLTRLWELSKSGLPEVETVAARLLWHCNNVLFRQISSWVVYGMLEDPCEEFFLQPQQARDGELPEAQEADGSEAAMGAAAAVQVRMASLPPYVSLKMAESIGFMGTSVRLLSRPQGRLAARQVLLQQDMQGVAEALHALQQRPVFSCLAFERTIEQLRTQVASLLWRVLDRDAHLQDHLQLIKDFFLLGRGDFFHTFLTEGAELLALPPREATASKDINTPFQQAAVMSDAHHIPLFDLLSIELSPPTSSKDEQAALPPIQLPEFSGRRDGAAGQQLSWDDISLQYQVEWPLGMLLTPRCMHLYRCMFRYLLRLKQCEIALHQLWTGPLLAQALTLQSHMRHLINNLHKYIQLDVLEPNFSALQAVMRKATDFEEVRRSHDAWLDAIVTQSLLLQPNLCRLLGRIFRSCRHLQQLVQPQSGLRAAASAHGMPLAEKVALIGKDFDTHSYQLYLLLSSTKLQGSDNAPRLQQLYLRLDFNGYVRQSLLKRLAVKGSSVAR